MPIRRRDFLLASAGVAVGGVGAMLGERLLAQRAVPATLPHVAAKVVAEPVSTQQAVERLIVGNERFVGGHMVHDHQTIKWRTALAQQQHPFAAVLGCADSRVPPEILFDQGLGDLFVVREAGNIADDDTLGSLEYAIEHLQVPLIVVLGHQQCGAVGAAVAAILQHERIDGHILRLEDDIAPAVREAKDQPGDVVYNAVRANVSLVVRKLRLSEPILREHNEKGDVKVVGACYNLETGNVEWLDV